MREESARLQSSINAISDVNSLISRNIRELEITKDYGIAINYRTDGYYNGDGLFVKQDNFSTWEFSPVPYDCIIYFNPDPGYMQICIFDNSISTTNFIKRYRNTDSTLPEQSNPLTIKAGQVPVITTNSAIEHVIIYTDYKAPVRLSDDISTKLKTDINNQLQESVDDKIMESVFDKSTGKELNSSSEYDLVTEGYGALNQIVHMENKQYTSYCLTVNQDTDVYVNSCSTDYFSICTYDDTSFKNGARYRKKGTEENTLPYKENPISIKAGTYMVITTLAGLDFSVILSSYTYIKSLKSSVPLADAHINQVKKEIKTDKCYLQYVSGSGKDHSTECVRIFTPAAIGYIEYEFVHTVYESINSDIWRVAYAYACDSSFNRKFNITTTGEWEIAIHLKDRSDFSGGHAHGDEMLLNVIFFIDGKIANITEYTEPTEFTNFVVVENSNLFDPNDSTTIIANHGSEHVFNASGLKINQNLLWKVNAELQHGCYMAMHLPAKAVTDHMYTNADINPTEVQFKNYTGINKVVVYGEESGVRTEFSVTKYPNIGSGYYFLMTDNGGGAYNKCYYCVVNVGNAKENELWVSETVYKFEVNK